MSSCGRFWTRAMSKPNLGSCLCWCAFIIVVPVVSLLIYSALYGIGWLLTGCVLKDPYILCPSVAAITIMGALLALIICMIACEFCIDLTSEVKELVDETQNDDYKNV